MPATRMLPADVQLQGVEWLTIDWAPVPGLWNPSLHLFWGPASCRLCAPSQRPRGMKAVLFLAEFASRTPRCFAKASCHCTPPDFPSLSPSPRAHTDTWSQGSPSLHQPLLLCSQQATGIALKKSYFRVCS